MKMTISSQMMNNKTAVAYAHAYAHDTGHHHGHPQKRTSNQLNKLGPEVKYKKAPQAPRRFKSPYIFFSTIKHKEIRAELALKNTKAAGEEGGGARKIHTPEVAKLVSKAWKALSEVERQKWDDLATQDKIRYEKEKLTYTGPWKVPVQVTTITTGTGLGRRGRGKGVVRNVKSRRPQQQQQPCTSGQQQSLDGLLSHLPQPIRPLSAFLLFSNSKRSLFASQKKKDTTTEHRRSLQHNNSIETLEMSRRLAQLWIESTPGERAVFVEEEFQSRQRYKTAMVEWKKQQQQQGQSTEKEQYHHLDEHDEQDTVELSRSINAVDDRLSPTTTDTTTGNTSSSATVYHNQLAASIFAPTTTTPASSSSLLSAWSDDHLSQLHNHTTTSTSSKSNPHPPYPSDLSQQQQKHNSGISSISSTAPPPPPHPTYSNHQYQYQQQQIGHQYKAVVPPLLQYRSVVGSSYRKQY
mmetsp:Transcript_11045/g.12389  ORF Transcript_11045/g.12389 Transcript_11045/m.12389 type:complete len:465 (+) Transcript_11045:614-2008(+)